MTARALGPARLHSVAARAASAAPGAASADSRPPVLLVHGAYHGAWCWDGWVERLDAEGWAVHALDLRGHGGLAPDAAFRLPEVEGVGVEFATADGQKCQRCWKVLPDVGTHRHPDVCGRCDAALG